MGELLKQAAFNYWEAETRKAEQAAKRRTPKEKP